MIRMAEAEYIFRVNFQAYHATVSLPVLPLPGSPNLKLHNNWKSRKRGQKRN